MIINTLENLGIYSKVYPHLEEILDYLMKQDFSNLKEGKNEFSENAYIVKIIAEKNSEFKGILEVHKEWIDIHIPLTTHDEIAYKEITSCHHLEKEYDVENDYALYNEPVNKILELEKNYFCIIDTTMAHMAMLGEGSIEKLVVKIRK